MLTAQLPAQGDGLLLDELPAEEIDELVRVSGAEAGSPLLSVEIRQLGGELGRSRPENGALSSAYDRLCRIKAEVDPTDLIRSYHPVPPG